MLAAWLSAYPCSLIGWDVGNQRRKKWKRNCIVSKWICS